MTEKKSDIKGFIYTPNFKVQRVLPAEGVLTHGGILLREKEDGIYFISKGKELGNWEKTAIFDLTALTNKTILDKFQFTSDVTQQQRFDIIETLAEHKTRIAIGRINDFLNLKDGNKLSQDGGKLLQIGAELLLGSPKSQYLLLRKIQNASKKVALSLGQKQGRER